VSPCRPQQPRQVPTRELVDAVEAHIRVVSGFYDVFMLLLGASIFRGVAIEFRSQRPGTRWRRTWEVTLAVSSAGETFGTGAVFRPNCWPASRQSKPLQGGPPTSKGP